MIEEERWVMQGLSRDDPNRIKSAEELERYVQEIGFLPLFRNEIPGFSAEERTASEDWWTGDADIDPWEWRKVIAARGNVAYGKFFDKKAGFISKEWFPVFTNFRRDGYDFDARWDDELAGIRSKKIMDRFMEENEGSEWFSSEIKADAGFGKKGEKNFEGEITRLQMQTYLIIRDFRRKLNKNGEEYGWGIAVYCTPEHLWGYEHVCSRYKEEPEESAAAIYEHAREILPDAGYRELRRVLGVRVSGESSSKKEVPYPDNLIRALKIEGLNAEIMTEDQKSGLEVAIGQLKDKQQKVIRMKYGLHMKNDEIGAVMNRAAGTIGTYHTKALGKLRWPRIAEWYIKGYSKCLPGCLVSRGHAALAAQAVRESPDPDRKIDKYDYCLRLGLPFRISDALIDAGIITIENLVTRMADPLWYRKIKGIGPKTAADIGEKVSRKTGDGSLSCTPDPNGTSYRES